MASRLQKILFTSCIWVRTFHKSLKGVQGRKGVKNPWLNVYIKWINERITVSSPFLKARPWPDTVFFCHLHSKLVNNEIHRTITSHAIFYKLLHVTHARTRTHARTHTHTHKQTNTHNVSFFRLQAPHSFGTRRNFRVTLFPRSIAFETSKHTYQIRSNLSRARLSPPQYIRNRLTYIVHLKPNITRFAAVHSVFRCIYSTHTIKYFYVHPPPPILNLGIKIPRADSFSTLRITF